MQTVKESCGKSFIWKLNVNERRATKGFVKFFGTGGARFVVSTQLRSTAGILLRYLNTNLYIDPVLALLSGYMQRKSVSTSPISMGLF